MSAQGGLPLAFDCSIPFVRAVVDAMEGRGGLEAAVEALAAAEARCGVAVWRDLAGNESMLGAGCYVPREPSHPPEPYELMVLVRDWSAFERRFELGTDGAPACLAMDARLERLLGETHLVIAGMDFSNDHFVRAADGSIAAWTQRAWGAFVAAWANAIGWGPHFNKQGQRYSWKYVDFYDSSVRIFEQHDRWVELVREVLRLKTLRALGAAEPRGA